jgi:hypothetical protein
MAQAEPDVTLAWQPVLNTPSRTTLTRLFGWDTDGFYACRQKQGGSEKSRQKIYLEKYSESGKLEKSREISLRHRGKNRKLEEFVYVNNKVYLFTTYHNLKDRKNYLFAQEVLPRSFTLSRKLSRVGELQTSSAHEEGDFQFTFSRDSQYLLAYGQHPLKKNEQEQFSLTVLDTSMTIVWEKTVSLPYPNRNFSIEECRVSPSGEVFVLGVLFEDFSTSRRQGSPNYQYRLLHYSESGNTVEEYAIGLDRLFITDLTFRINRDKYLICAGFYSEKNSYSIKGVCYVRINLERKDIEGIATRPFDFDFLTQHHSPNQRRKAEEAEQEGNVRKQPELYNYDLNELILRNDGGAVLIAEQFFVDRQEYWDWWTGQRIIEFYYNYNDIILANIRPDGSIQWTARIPKQQVSLNDNGFYSSYARAIARDRLLFVFNDERGSGRRGRLNSGNSNLVMAEVQLDGKVNTFLLEDNRGNPVIPRPKSCRQVSRNRMIITGEYGRNFRIGSLYF